jgi:alanyl-tRNA synthetase
LNKAKSGCATALFGEKYGERVRVVTMGEISKELCGGTHTSSTGQIGLFHITSEAGISAGVRRIEAITGLGSLNALRKSEVIVSQLCETLKVGQDALIKRIVGLQDSVKQLEIIVSRGSHEKVAGQVAALIEEARKTKGKFLYIAKNIGACQKDEFGPFSDVISDKLKSPDYHNVVVVVGAIIDNKAQLFAAAGPMAIKAGVNCGAIIKEAAQKAGGSGGGSPMRAQAGCKDIDKIDAAIETARKALAAKAEG